MTDEFDRALVDCLPALRRFAIRLRSGRKADVDDLVQETAFKALRARSQFVPGTNMKAWLFTIMRNEHMSQVRIAGRLVGDPDDLNSKLFPSNDDQAAAYEAKDAISHLFLIQPKLAEAVVMIAMGDRYEDVAAKLGVPDGTVKSRASRGRAELEYLLGGVPA